MATSEILPFASVDTGTNLDTQAAYLAASDRTNGNQPGVARSKLVNKALRQVSIIAAGVADFIAARQAANITDSLSVAQVSQYLGLASAGGLAVITVNGNFTVPAGVYAIEAELWAGGGGGGGVGSIGNGSASGGGGGGYARGVFSVTPGQVIVATVGLGGTAGATGTSGGNGGASGFGGFLSATGGIGGSANSVSTGGAGGTGTGGQLQGVGGGGGAGLGASTNGPGANGGGAPFGGAGGNSAPGSAGAGVIPGGGGGGPGSAAIQPGAAGARGQINIRY